MKIQLRTDCENEGRWARGAALLFTALAMLTIHLPQARGEEARPALSPSDPRAFQSASAPRVDLSILPAFKARALPSPDEKWDLHPVLRAIRRESSGMEFLREELVLQLRETLPGRGEGVLIEGVRLPANLTLPDTPWEANFQFRLPQRGVGTVVYTGVLMTQGRSTNRLTGSLTIDRIATGVQTRRVVRRGERVRDEDLITLETRLSRLPNDAFSSHKTLAGTAARAELRPGVWLTGRMLEQPSAVRRGQPITMRLINGPIRIVTKGIANQNGALGEVILVKNLESKKEVLARVISNDLVEVVFVSASDAGGGF